MISRILNFLIPINSIANAIRITPPVAVRSCLRASEIPLPIK